MISMRLAAVLLAAVLLLPRAAAWDVLLLTAVTVAASLAPALRAARLKPITAMHHIG